MLFYYLYFYFIYLLASDTCNLDPMYPYQVLFDVTRNKVFLGKCRHNNV